MSADTEALLATVREALNVRGDDADEYNRVDNANAALDSLAAELEEYAKVKKHYGGTEYAASWERASLLAELERVKEHDERLSELNFEMAERLDKALAALRFYGERHRYHSECCGNCIANDGGYIARAAIAESEGKSD